VIKKDIEGKEEGKKKRWRRGRGGGEKEGESGGTSIGTSCLYMPSFLGNQLLHDHTI